MSAKTVAELGIDVNTDTSDAVRGFDAVEDSARSMERAVESGGDAAENSARRLSISADGADDLATKTGTATGALGALSGGLEAVGLEKYAAGLQITAIATDVASGASDLLSLAMNSTAISTVKAKVATVAHAGATKASAVAAKTFAAGQWLLNAALTANPIGLVVVGVAALVAGFILAYKKSETFRQVVNVVMTAVVGYIKLVTFPMRTLIGFIKDLVEKIPGVSTAFRAVRDTAKAIGKALVAPFQAVADVIQNILDLIGKIKIPKLPDIKGGGVPFVPGLRVSSGTGDFDGGGQPTIVNNYTISGLLDSHDLVRTLEDLFAKQGRRVVVSGP